MPANLTAEAQAKWQEAQVAKNPREKLQAYQEFLSTIPQHKGNERLRAQIKTKIAELKEEIAARRGRRGGGSSLWSVEREGAAQVMLCGPTNVGRSSLLRSLTNAHVNVATYEYTTQRPIPGMLQFEDIQLQLVELPAPPLDRDGQFQMQREALDLIRSSSGLMLVVDLSADTSWQFRSMISALEQARISIQKLLSRVEVLRGKGSGEIRIAASSQQKSCTPTEIRQLLQSYGIKNALVRIYGDASQGDVEDAIFENVMTYKPALVVGTKADLCDTRRASLELSKNLPVGMPALVTSCLTGEGLKDVGGTLFRILGIIRVYTREPNEPRPSKFPFVVQAGTTVGELARSIHTDLANRYRYSRIWGPTSRFPGERVGPDHVLGDRDTVEIRTD